MNFFLPFPLRFIVSCARAPAAPRDEPENRVGDTAVAGMIPGWQPPAGVCAVTGGAAVPGEGELTRHSPGGEAFLPLCIFLPELIQRGACRSISGFY